MENKDNASAVEQCLLKTGEQKRNLNRSKDRPKVTFRNQTGNNHYRAHYYISSIETTK